MASLRDPFPAPRQKKRAASGAALVQFGKFPLTIPISTGAAPALRGAGKVNA